MFDRAARALSILVALGAPAAALSAILTLACRLFGASPALLAGALGAGLVGAAAPPARGRGAFVAATFAVLAVGAARPLLGGAWRAGGPVGLAAAGLGIALLVGWGLVAPARIHQRDGAFAAGSALLAAPLAMWGAPVPLVSLAFGATLLLLRGGGAHPAGAGAGAVARGGRVGVLLGAAAGAAAVLAGLLVFSVIRTRVDPTPAAVGALLSGGALGATLPAPRWARALIAVLLAAAVFERTAAGWGGEEPLLATAGSLAALGIILALGGSAGAAMGALTPARAGGLAVLAAALALPSGLARLPESVVAVASTPEATLLGDAGRAEALARVHTEWRRVYAGLGAGGATAAWVRGTGVVVELDGVPFDPSSRQGAAERFSGLLATCATAGRDRARVSDDPAGLALGALRSAGFSGIDVATPDPGLVRTLAAEFPDLGRAWLAPGVRLLAVPGAAVVRLGGEADAVVEAVRAPWSDAARGFPVEAALADTRATLAPGGVHVVALSTTAITPAGLAGWLRAFVRVYPGASLWVPPAGADTAVLLGPRDAGAIPWERVEVCAALPAAGALGLRAPLDIAGLLLAGPDALRGLPEGPIPGPGLPPPMPIPGPPPLTQLALTDPDLDGVLGAGTPIADVAARHATLDSFLALLRSSASGEMASAVAQARALAGAPGGTQALVPLVRPQLDRVRAAIARGTQEGIASRAWEEAETALTSARVLAPDYPETRCVEGDLALARNQLTRAGEAYEACAKGEPQSLTPLDGLATVRRLQQDPVGLEAVLRRARDVRPDAWTTAHNLGFFLYSVRRYDEAERLLREGAAGSARTDAPSSAPHLALSHLYLDTARPERALAEAVQATRLSPESSEAAFLRGASRYDLGQLRLAEEEFRAALRLDPQNVRARGGLGLVQAQDGAYAAAAESFRAVLAVEPRNQAVADNLRRVEALVQGGGATAGD